MRVAPVAIYLGLSGPGGYSAEDKYRIFMRYRYTSCVEILLEHLSHEQYDIKVSCLSVTSPSVAR